MSLAQLIYFFTIYSFIGWLVETIYVSYKSQKFVNRGFLFGPFCPIYGFGAISVIILVSPLSNHNIFLFLAGAILVTSSIEYLTGVLSELLFQVNWWDYSKEKFNLNGKICLRNSLYWGALSFFFITFFNPPINSFIQKLIPLSPVFFPSLILLYFITDFTLVTISLYGFKNILNSFNQLKNQSLDYFDLNNLKNEIIYKQTEILSHFTKRYQRLLKAFPNLKSSKYYVLDDIKAKIEEIKTNNLFH